LASPRQQLQRVLELRSAAAKNPGRAVSSHGRVPTRAFACAWLGTDAEPLAGGALTLWWARSPANGPEPAPAISSGEPSRPPPPFEWRERREESAREETKGSTATGSTAARLRARAGESCRRWRHRRPGERKKGRDRKRARVSQGPAPKRDFVPARIALHRSSRWTVRSGHRLMGQKSAHVGSDGGPD